MAGVMGYFSLEGKVALITGASRGIGEAIARGYAEAGARVVLASRKQEGLDAVAAEIEAAGGHALALAAHTGDDAAVQRLVERVAEVYGGIDILVNNAATNPHFGPILSSEESHWDKTLDVNVKGYFRLAKACVPWMRARGGGKIINMASIAGTTPQPGMGVYCVSKAAVLMLTEVLAVELAADNIQVNAVAPGFVKTKFSAAIWDNPALNRATLAGIPQQRMAEPDELVGIALYLASGASSFTTGSTFLVDGGPGCRRSPLPVDGGLALIAESLACRLRHRLPKFSATCKIIIALFALPCTRLYQPIRQRLVLVLTRGKLLPPCDCIVC